MPPFARWLVLGLQQVSVVSVSLLIPLVVAQTAGMSPKSISSVLSFSMIAIGIASLLQAFRWGPLGAGYLIPGFCSGNYLSASVAAAQVGGLPLVYGMTVVAGAFEAILSRFVSVLRPFFPPELSGIAVTIIGLELGVIAVDRMFCLSHSVPDRTNSIIAAMLTFFLTVLMSIYGKGPLRLFCALIGVTSGYVWAIWMDLIPDYHWHVFSESQILSLPDISHISWSFDASLLVPFLLASVASTLKTIGAVTTCQKINDVFWIRPEMNSVKRGVFADGISTIVAGCLGATGQNSATSGIGVSRATGATSRFIGIAIAVWLVFMAASPTLISLIVIMPNGVMGGALMFSACYMIASGIQIIASNTLDNRRTAVVGFAIILAVSRPIFPELYENAPQALQPFVHSGLAMGVTAAMILNLLLCNGERQENDTSYIDFPHGRLPKPNESCEKKPQEKVCHFTDLPELMNTVFANVSHQDLYNRRCVVECHITFQHRQVGNSLQIPVHTTSGHEIDDISANPFQKARFVLPRMGHTESIEHDKVYVTVTLSPHEKSTHIDESQYLKRHNH